MQARALLFVFVCFCLFSLLFFSPKQLVQYLFNTCLTLVQRLFNTCSIFGDVGL